MSTRPSREHPDRQAGAHAHGCQIVIRLAGAGRRMGGAIEERLGSPELVGNVPVLVLCELALHGPLRPRDLLEATNLTSGGLTKQLDHLESLGLIERAFGTLRDDRRASVVSLTPEGARTADAIGEAAESQLDEVRSLVDALTRLIDR
jgi:DNA-binding MarR family transcriptional regulator